MIAVSTCGFLVGVCLRHLSAYLLASHLLDLVEGLVQVVLLACVHVVVVVHVVVHGGDCENDATVRGEWLIE